MLILIGIAPESELKTWIVFGIMMVYYFVLMFLSCGGSGKFRKGEKTGEEAKEE